ncbi:response regulator [Hymenobacter psychrotolerans]|uniref:Response regulator receiver domain-containing protein n=1 Tax=Hymenobacter psychrotolerans DSM 18569 TaxID=1121959 RepID=A0A1M6V9H3_9BACT|nr:response regulator [Hymenobacter psychrotolerans]SHK78098.1 Response regulator receiver domain-containing protein [Hymenobacter psychrotolerans DSM 18569]
MKILLVEDEPKVSAFIRRGLEEEGFAVDVAFDGDTGRRLALAQPYDLVILDVILPHFNGYEVLATTPYAPSGPYVGGGISVRLPK